MEPVEFGEKTYMGLRKDLGNLPLIIVRAKRGYVACSYLSRETAEKIGDVAAFVSGVKEYPEFFNAKIRSATSWAEDMGIREGMSVRKALEIMDTEEKE